MWAKSIGDDTIRITLSPNEATVSHASPHVELHLQKFPIQDVDGMMERVQQYEQQAQSHFRQPENEHGEFRRSQNAQSEPLQSPNQQESNMNPSEPPSR